MKVGIIPDIHGNLNFEEKLSKLENKVEKIIFLGDYCDSHKPESNWLIQKRGLDKILSLKKANPEFYTLLFGNHDQHYMVRYGAQSGSNKQYFQMADIQEYLIKEYSNFQAIEVIDNWIFSHAGISKDWLQGPNTDPWRGVPIEENWKLEDVNKHFKKKELKYFNHHSWDAYGDDPIEGCMWIRPPALIRYGISGYNQCVGHTALAPGEYMEYWHLDDRVVTGQEYWDKKHYYQHQYREGADNLKSKYVFLDSPDQEYYSIIDTKSNEVEILKVGE